GRGGHARGARGTVGPERPPRAAVAGPRRGEGAPRVRARRRCRHAYRHDHRRGPRAAGAARARPGRGAGRTRPRGAHGESPGRVPEAHREGAAGMIGLIVQNAWTQLRRDRAAQILAFVVPIAFFSIFAIIFGGGGNRMNGTSRVAVAVVDEEGSERSRALVEALKGDSALRVITTRAVRAGENAPLEPLTRATAEQMVKNGDVPVALVLPAGVGASIGSFNAAGAKALVLHDPSDPVAGRTVGGLLQRAALRAAGARPPC